MFVDTDALAWVNFRSRKDTRKMVEETKQLANAATQRAGINRQALETDVYPWLAPPRNKKN